MIYGSCCSGIEAATKTCASCKGVFPLSSFHRQPRGPMGRHSYCKACANARQRETRIRHITPERRRRTQLKHRYGLTPEDVDGMLAAQGGRCAICRSVPTRPVVDHDHTTGAVRGILCHGCNIKLPAAEDTAFLSKARAYLARERGQ